MDQVICTWILESSLVAECGIVSSAQVNFAEVIVVGGKYRLLDISKLCNSLLARYFLVISLSLLYYFLSFLIALAIVFFCTTIGLSPYSNNTSNNIASMRIRVCPTNNLIPWKDSHNVQNRLWTDIFT